VSRRWWSGDEGGTGAVDRGSAEAKAVRAPRSNPPDAIRGSTAASSLSRPSSIESSLVTKDHRRLITLRAVEVHRGVPSDARRMAGRSQPPPACHGCEPLQRECEDDVEVERCSYPPCDGQRGGLGGGHVRSGNGPRGDGQERYTDSRRSGAGSRGPFEG
jgi:hypothetical protein